MDRRLAHQNEEWEDARIERKKRENEILRQRLLNPKERICGRDESALMSQIAEKKAQKQREIDEDYAYARHVAETNISLSKAEAERKAAKREEALRLQDQYLNEAARRAEEKEAEVKEYHSKVIHVGPSSLQRFEGEDAGAARRRKLQAEQMRRFVAKGEAERRQRQEEEREMERLHAEHIKRQVVDQEIAERAAQEEANRRRKEVQLYNQMQASMKADEAKFQRQVSCEKERSETAAPMLAQPEFVDPADHASSVAPHRVRPDHYRGIGEDVLKSFRVEQQEQVRAKMEREFEEKQKEQLYAQQQRRLYESSCYIARQEHEAKRQAKRNILEDQKRQIEEKKLASQAKAAYDAQPAFTDEFFGNFGTSHR